MKITLFILAGFLVFLILTIEIGRIVNKQKYKIHSKEGIQKSELINIGGIEQYIQIRGQNVLNPVIIILHGGPGSNMADYSYFWQNEMESKYTIIHWDQRGCANTYYQNKNAEKPTLELLLSDLDELVTSICSKLSQDKVILMGHSWGTFLGAAYSIIHPEKISLYISVSQMLDLKKSEQVSAQEAIRLANKIGKFHGAKEIAERLNTIMNYQEFGKIQAMELLRFRQLKEKYLPSQYNNRIVFLRLFSPYMTFNDLRWMFDIDALIETNSNLYSTLLSEDTSSICSFGLQYKIPFILVAGDHDWTTPYGLAAEYYNSISSPYKKIITIKNAGHIPFIDKPKEFSERLMEVIETIPNK